MNCDVLSLVGSNRGDSGSNPPNSFTGAFCAACLGEVAATGVFAVSSAVVEDDD